MDRDNFLERPYQLGGVDPLEILVNDELNPIKPGLCSQFEDLCSGRVKRLPVDSDKIMGS